MSDQEDRFVHVRLNGAAVALEKGKLIPFAELVACVGMSGHPSVTVRRKGAEGFIFTPGDSRLMQDGDVVSICHTDNA